MYPPCLKLLFPIRVGFRFSNYESMLNLNSIIDGINDAVFVCIDITKLPFRGNAF